ncbi:MAG: ABC transporter ATP-binding protein [Victivallaceae bacterium]|nr:ABC transporter ATP-binding protein [Victivallaceae bacterium]
MSLQAKNLSFGYGKKTILCNVSATLEKGKVVFLLGENGSGKTTLLKLLARLLVPQQGGIFLDGNAAERFSRREYAQKIGVMSQTLRPALDFSVAEFCLIGRNAKLERFGGAKKDDLDAVGRALHQVGLTAKSACPARRLSGGEFQRLALAAALAAESSYLLLDEPVSAQDPPRARELLEKLRSQAVNCGILVVAHDLDLAALYADEVWLLADGNLFAAGPPQTVLTAENVGKLYHCRVTQELTQKGFLFR